MPSPEVLAHQIWLEAHYALGKLEVQQGFQLGWRERSKFIKDYIQSQVTDQSGEIESNIQPPTKERNG